MPLYLAALRLTAVRDGMILMVDDERFRPREGEVTVHRSIRFRALGCYPLPGDDQAASMEKTKQEGYF